MNIRKNTIANMGEHEKAPKTKLDVKQIADENNCTQEEILYVLSMQKLNVKKGVAKVDKIEFDQFEIDLELMLFLRLHVKSREIFIDTSSIMEGPHLKRLLKFIKFYIKKGYECTIIIPEIVIEELAQKNIDLSEANNERDTKTKGYIKKGVKSLDKLHQKGYVKIWDTRKNYKHVTADAVFIDYCRTYNLKRRLFFITNDNQLTKDLLTHNIYNSTHKTVVRRIKSNGNLGITI